MTGQHGSTGRATCKKNNMTIVILSLTSGPSRPYCEHSHIGDHRRLSAVPYLKDLMRVTAETKATTRKTILQTAQRLFAENGYDATRTRDIANAAGIATGTLFNYFQTKEAIVASLADEAIGEAIAQAQQGGADSLEEDLFALVAAGLRKLKSLRKHLPALLETALSPLAEAPSGES